MDYFLGKVQVSYQLHSAFQDARKDGKKVNIMLVEDSSMAGKTLACKNCRGSGEIMMERIIGGPSEAPMYVKKGGIAVTTYIDGLWYKRILEHYVCPSCHQSGSKVRGAEQELQL